MMGSSKGFYGYESLGHVRGHKYLNKYRHSISTVINTAINAAINTAIDLGPKRIGSRPTLEVAALVNLLSKRFSFASNLPSLCPAGLQPPESLLMQMRS